MTIDRLTMPKKSGRRVQIVDRIVGGLTNPKIFKTLSYERESERNIKTYMHRFLVAQVRRVYRELFPEQSERTIERKAEKAVLWESDKTTTINNFLFLGVQHRPDFVVQMEGLRIAVEIKRGESGSGVREGIGQSVVYASQYDFVCYIFIDASKDKKVKRSLQDAKERKFVRSLWENYNVRFDVV